MILPEDADGAYPQSKSDTTASDAFRARTAQPLEQTVAPHIWYHFPSTLVDARGEECSDERVQTRSS